MEHECNKTDRINFLDEKLKKFESRIDKVEENLRIIGTKTELQGNSIINIEKKVESLDSKMGKFNNLLITNLVSILFLILSSAGYLIFFIASGGTR